MAAVEEQLVGAAGEEHKEEKSRERLYPSFAPRGRVGQATGRAPGVQRSWGAALPMGHPDSQAPGPAAINPPYCVLK